VAHNVTGICDVGALALQMFNEDIIFHNIFQSFIRITSSPNIANTHVVCRPALALKRVCIQESKLSTKTCLHKMQYSVLLMLFVFRRQL
jgi:hypothetical protein